MEIADTFGFLLGSWTLTRKIDDRKNGLSGSFEGTAIFDETSDGCGLYRETGEMAFGGYLGEADRTLHAQRCADGTVALTFPDGRRYIEMNLSQQKWSAQHLCGSDTYEINLEVKSRELLVEQWMVRGPKKCYDALTILRRR